MDKVLYSYNTEQDSELEEENRVLRETINQLKNELDRYRTPPLMVCDVQETLPDNHAIIKIPNGNQFYVTLSNQAKKIKAGDTVLVDQKNLNVIRKIGQEKSFNVEKFVIIEKPNLPWEEIGGLSEQINEIKEVVELPLLKPELFKKVGIQPPKGVLLHGPPGTGKTLLAKGVATSTNSTFIEIVGSELVQKFIGEGAKLVKEIFQLAKEKSPSIIFIDEIDSLAAKRIEIGTSGEREVQRTFMQLLAEIDGFKHLGDVKVIACTNRKDILDPAVMRPGRLDRHIMVPQPDLDGVRQIFRIHTKNMKFDKDFSSAEIIKKLEGFSGAEIKAVVTEAGYFAIRENRSKVVEDDFLKAVKKVKKNEEEHGDEYIKMFG
ncbi:AAA family ATPase [Candidatus Woesearchaeota archaeon]|nr:AAA family ATPase [Candidatus Woesearchaeota archaeon]